MEDRTERFVVHSKRKALTQLLILSMLGSLSLTGCGQESTVEGKPGAEKRKAYNNEPVTLTFYSQNASVLNDADLGELVTKAIKSKYPNITPKLLTGDLEKLISGGEVPDIVLSALQFVPKILRLELYSDMNEFIKQEGIDLGKFEPETVRATKSFSDKGEFVGMPYAMSYGMLLVNKDIFDKLAVPYPSDGMNWSEVLGLAARVTRLHQDTSYIGLDLTAPTIMTRQAGLPVVDDKGEKAIIHNEGYKKVYSLYERLYGISGIVAGKKYTYGINYFMRDQKTAMFPYWLIPTTVRLPELRESGKAFNWDVVSYPSFDDKPGYGRDIDFHMALVSPKSPNKQAANAVIKTLVSEEAQRAMNRGIRMTVLADPALRKEVAADTKLYEGKNLQGIFKAKLSPSPKASIYDQDLYPFLVEAAEKMAFAKTDVNTVLREAEEKANQYLQQELGKLK